MAGLTWVFDSRYGDATIDGQLIAQRRMMVNSAGGARLYTKGSTSPVRKLRDASYGAEDGRWVIEGVNEETELPEVWSMPVTVKTQRCGSCGG